MSDVGVFAFFFLGSPPLIFNQLYSEREPIVQLVCIRFMFLTRWFLILYIASPLYSAHLAIYFLLVIK